MPNPRREKGNRAERAVLASLKGLGVRAERVPLSGSAGGSYTGDLRLKLYGRELRAEVKARKQAAGWKTIIQWLGPHDVLFLKEDRQEPLVVLPWRTWTHLLEQIVDTSETIPAGREISPGSEDLTL